MWRLFDCALSLHTCINTTERDAFLCSLEIMESNGGGRVIRQRRATLGIVVNECSNVYMSNECRADVC